jgi:antitoxin ParD1/3/4
MNVSLTPELEKFVEKEVDTGLYQTASEVVRAGLRLLKREQMLKLVSVQSPADLETKLLHAAESLDAGRGVSGEAVFARLRQRSQARRKNG